MPPSSVIVRLSPPGSTATLILCDGLRTKATGKPESRTISMATGLILPLDGCSTGGVMRSASGTLSVLPAQPEPETVVTGEAPGM